MKLADIHPRTMNHKYNYGTIFREADKDVEYMTVCLAAGMSRDCLDSFGGRGTVAVVQMNGHRRGRCTFMDVDTEIEVVNADDGMTNVLKGEHGG